MAYLYLDIETTGLDEEYDQITEIAWITSYNAEEHHFVHHDRLPNEWVLQKTDYLTRILPSSKVATDEAAARLTNSCQLAKQLQRYELLGRRAMEEPQLYLVGANPAFDDRFLRKILKVVPYNYHLIDIETVLMGYLGLSHPPRLKECRGFLGIADGFTDQHTALGDAREVKLIHEVWMKAVKAPRVG